MAGFVARVMSALGVDSAVVVGVSMGGDVALNLGLHHPERVRGLVLVAPGGLVAAAGSRAFQMVAWLGTRLPDALLLPGARLANRLIEPALRRVVHDRASLPEEVVAEFKREGLRPGASVGYIRYNQATVGRRGQRNDVMSEVSRPSPPRPCSSTATSTPSSPRRGPAERPPSCPTPTSSPSPTAGTGRSWRHTTASWRNSIPSSPSRPPPEQAQRRGLMGAIRSSVVLPLFTRWLIANSPHHGEARDGTDGAAAGSDCSARQTGHGSAFGAHSVTSPSGTWRSVR